MTLYKPTIFLLRLVVTKGGARVFDEKFHAGLNIVRGENGSGKTTIADFIFFILGGDTPHWRAEAALCDYVFAEVAINGELITLRRQVEQETRRPMAIFWGSFEKAVSTGTEWQLYPYAGSSAKESFSQVLLKAADIPEVKGLLSAKITLHQIMRLIYVDQRTDYEQIFRADPFDPQLTREAVGDLLCGVYDDRLYEAEIQRSEKESERNKLQSELKAMFSILGSSGIPDLAKLGEQKGILEKQREQAYSEYKAVQTGETTMPNGTLSAQRAQIAQDLANQNENVKTLEYQIETSQVEVADRQQFVDALKARLLALDESETVHKSLGMFSFKFCPACYVPLSDVDGKCHLCKDPNEDRPGQNLLRLRHDLEQQIRESEGMQKNLAKDIAGFAAMLRPALDRQRSLQLQYDEISTTASSTLSITISEIHRRIGYFDRAIEDTERHLQLADRVSAINEQQALLASDIAKLLNEIEARKVTQQEIKSDIAALISDLTISFLREDLPRETAFSSPVQVNFDFGANQLAVDGRKAFAASSNVYLKNAFHLAMLQASTLREYMRYPRLLIFDNVEDKGMEAARSHNFQKIVRELSSDMEIEHQIIMFTSMIAPELENTPDLLVGPYYTHEFKTLRMGPVTSISQFSDQTN
jgi:hypothetical protein